MFALAKSLIAVALAASTAVASNVPVFSASDDYDEVNLNIRLLAKHNATDDGKATPTKVIASVTAEFTVPEGATPESLNADTAFKSAVGSAIATALEVKSSDVTVTKISAARLRGRALQTTLSLKIDFEVLVASASAASAMADSLASGSAAAFEAALTTALTTELAALGADYAVSAVASGGATTEPASKDAATDAPVAAAPAAAAPAASSSDATMLKTNMAVAAVAALAASIFC